MADLKFGGKTGLKFPKMSKWKAVTLALVAAGAGWLGWRQVDNMLDSNNAQTLLESINDQDPNLLVAQDMRTEIHPDDRQRMAGVPLNDLGELIRAQKSGDDYFYRVVVSGAVIGENNKPVNVEHTIKVTEQNYEAVGRTLNWLEEMLRNEAPGNEVINGTGRRESPSRAPGS